MSSEMYVSSEVNQDQFLDSVNALIFEDEEEDEKKNRSVITRFPISWPPQEAHEPSFLDIEHFRLSEVDLVGLQVWRGALLLADFILSSPSIFKGKNVLELASGTGLTSVVAGIHASSVIATDKNHGDIIHLIRRNLMKNQSVLKCVSSSVRELDFFSDLWKNQLKEEICDLDLVLAADVVYDKTITEGFFRTIEYLIDTCQISDIFIAIERRFQITPDGSKASNNFNHFQELLKQLSVKSNAVLTQEPCNFHQYFKSYDRVNDLYLFRLNFKKITKNASV